MLNVCCSFWQYCFLLLPSDAVWLQQLDVFILFRFIGGLAIGGASVLCPVYISEISPPKHRGLLASTFQLAIVSGILLSLISNYLLLNIGENNWRWMLFSGAITCSCILSDAVLHQKKSPMAGKKREDR